MTTFTIDRDNNITAFGSPEEAQDALALGAQAFVSQKELDRLAAGWPGSRLVEIWNGFAGVAPFDDLKQVKKFTNRRTATTRIWTALQKLAANSARQAAHGAPMAEIAEATGWQKQCARRTASAGRNPAMFGQSK